MTPDHAKFLSEVVGKQLQTEWMTTYKTIKAVPEDKNPAKRLARAIAGPVPHIYTTPAFLGVARFFKALLNENAKKIADVDLVPESNMPAYPWLAERKAKDTVAADIDRKMAALNKVGLKKYSDEEIAGAKAPRQVLDGVSLAQDQIVAHDQRIGGRFEAKEGWRRFASAVDDLEDVDLDRYPTLRLMRRAFEMRANVSAYDASYIALAEGLACTFLTTDERLARAPGSRCQIEVLGEGAAAKDRPGA